MPEVPKKLESQMFQKYEIEGIEVYLPRTLLLNGPAVKIGLGGFWKMRWLKVDGVAMAAAACAY